MYLPDYGNMSFLYEERLRDAERHHAHERLIQAAMAHGQFIRKPSLLSQLVQRLHVKSQPADASEKRDTRQMHAV